MTNPLVGGYAYSSSTYSAWNVNYNGNVNNNTTNTNNGARAVVFL